MFLGEWMDVKAILRIAFNNQLFIQMISVYLRYEEHFMQPFIKQVFKNTIKPKYNTVYVTPNMFNLENVVSGSFLFVCTFFYVKLSW